MPPKKFFLTPLVRPLYLLALLCLVYSGTVFALRLHSHTLFAAPVVTAINPNSVNAGGAAFTLSVEGSNFAADSVIRWNGNDRPTTFINTEQITTAIPASDIVTAGTASISVFTPGTGGGISNALTLTIINVTNPVPAITSLSPNAIAAGNSGFTLIVNGTGFVSNSTIRFGSSNKRTTFVSATQITAPITATDLNTIGNVNVQVLNPAPGGGVSNIVQFAVTAPTGNPVPTLTSVNPNSAVVGSDELIVTLTGTNFVNGAIARWNGSNRQTTFVSDTQLKATITVDDLGTLGTAAITVFNPAPGGGISNSQSFAVNSANPIPTLTTISPAAVTAGSGSFELTASGSNFVPGAIVRINGADRDTTFVNDKQLNAAITAADIANAGTATISVFNPAPGGGTSETKTLTINGANPLPTLTSMTPDTVPAGGSTFTLTVNGTGFVSMSTIRWNGTNRRTTFVSDTQLTTVIPASLLTTAGTAAVTVLSPAPGGGTSNTLNFTISEGNPVPILNSVSPQTAVVGNSDFTLTINGSNFVNGAVVRWNGADRPTTFVSYTQLTAAIPAGDLLSAGTIPITIFNPAPGGGISSAVNFTITPPPNPVPMIANLAPSSINVLSDEFTLTINGSDFVENAVVRWKGSDRATTFVNSTQLKAVILDTDLAVAGSAAVTVFNPAPGGGISNSVNFAVIDGNPIPTLTSLSPLSIHAGSGVLSLTINGLGFVSGSTVRWNTGTRRTTFVSDKQLIATISAGDVAAEGTATVQVLNPSPGGGLSNSLTFTITPSSNPVPTLSSVSPNLIAVSNNKITLAVTGINFVLGSIVRWNGADRPTTFVSNGTLTAEVPATDLAAPGDVAVTVFNPTPGGGASSAKGVQIVRQLVNVSAARFTGGNLARDSIVAAFGSGLTATTASATTLPLPTTLANTIVFVKDSQGTERAAPLFFVSPTQINYQIPGGTVHGTATVTIRSAGVITAIGTMNVVATAPGLFSADASGQGVAAAQILRSPQGGQQTWEDVAQFDSLQNRITARLIDLGGETEEVYLVLFGIGLRHHSGLSNVSLSIGGITLPAQFAGAQGDFAGLDQVNVLLPKSLRGKGEVEVILIVDGVASNAVKVKIK